MSNKKKITDSYNGYASKWVKRMREGKNSAHEYLEKPAMYKLLPDLNDKQVLCVGCGSGEECEYLRKLGAQRVVGIDLAEKLIEIAERDFPECEFKVMDIEKLEFPDGSFDFIYSSLVMHYLHDWNKALNETYRVLRTGGVYLFSTHHPFFNGTENSKDESGRVRLYGYREDRNKNLTIYGDYYSEILIDDAWFDGEFEISYYHRPFESMFRDIIASGFRLVDYVEPRPVESSSEYDRYLYEVHSRIPLFVIFKLMKS